MSGWEITLPSWLVFAYAVPSLGALASLERLMSALSCGGRGGPMLNTVSLFSVVLGDRTAVVAYFRIFACVRQTPRSCVGAVGTLVGATVGAVVFCIGTVAFFS